MLCLCSWQYGLFFFFLGANTRWWSAEQDETVNLGINAIELSTQPLDMQKARRRMLSQIRSICLGSLYQIVFLPLVQFYDRCTSFFVWEVFVNGGPTVVACKYSLAVL